MNTHVDWVGEFEFGRVIENHPKQVGYAFRNTANEAVREVQEKAKAEYSKRFVERNTFSSRGIQYDKARSHDIDQIEAIVGAKKNRPWMAKQEEGFTSSSAQASEHIRVSGNYKRSVRTKNYIRGVNIRRASLVPNKAKTRSGKAKAMMAISFRHGYGLPNSTDFFYFESGEVFSAMEEGYYQFAESSPVGSLDYPKIRLAYRLGNERRLQPEPWLEDAIKQKAAPKMLTDMFISNVREQLRRFS
jgi:hypothetical protein